jgi:hypothetical protein
MNSSIQIQASLVYYDLKSECHHAGKRESSPSDRMRHLSLLPSLCGESGSVFDLDSKVVRGRPREI